jgi:tetratricopeptide (TPR) repeat protein
MFHAWNWSEAKAAFRKAIALNPKLARAHLLYALYCTAAGQHDEALRLMETARDLEPLSPVINMGTAWALHFAGRAEEAVRETLRVEELSPGFEEAGNMRMTCFENLRRYADAADLMIRQRCWGLPLDGAALKQALADGGEAAYWRRKLEMLNELEETTAATRDLQLALTLMRVGQTDEALTMLERAVDKRTGMGVFLEVDPTFASLRLHPRFKALTRRIGIPST